MYVDAHSSPEQRYVRVVNDDTARARATLGVLVDITLGHVRELPGLDELDPRKRQILLRGDAFAAQLLPELPDVGYDETLYNAVIHTLTISTRTVTVSTSYTVKAQREGVYSGRTHEHTHEHILPTDEFTVQGLAQLVSGLHHLHREIVADLQSQSA